MKKTYQRPMLIKAGSLAKATADAKPSYEE